MKNKTLKTLHERAINIVELIDKADNRIIDFKTRIEIEENKPINESFLHVSKSWCEQVISDTITTREYLMNRYRSIIEQIKKEAYDAQAY